MGDVDRKVVGAIGEILTPDLVDDALARVRQLREPGGRNDVRDRIADELVSVQSQLANLTEAIAIGGDMPALVARLRQADSRRQELARQQDALGDGPGHPSDRLALSGAPGAAARRRLARTPLPATSRGRQVLRALLEGPILFTPIIEDTRRGVQFDGALSIGEILAGNVLVTSMASPVRLERTAFRLGGGRSIH